MGPGFEPHFDIDFLQTWLDDIWSVADSWLVIGDSIKGNYMLNNL